MSNTPKKSSQPTTGTSTKRGFWIPDALYERVQEYVSKHRNAPDDMTINKFVREAMSAKLAQLEGKRRAVRA